MNIFERAARKKLRFEMPGIGRITTEDLWDMPLTHSHAANLNDLAKTLNREIRNTDSDEDFVTTTPSSTTAETATLKLKFDLVKHIIDVRLKERESAEKAQETRAKKQKVMELINRKKDAAMEEMDIDALEKMLESL